MWDRIYFHFLSSLSLIRANKLLACFTAISYFIGILMPIFVVSIMVHDEEQTKSAFMMDSQQIIQIQETQFHLEDLKQKEKARTILFEHLYGDPAVQHVFYKTESYGILAYGTHMRYGHYVYVDESFHKYYSKFVEEGRLFNSLKKDECIVGTELLQKLWRTSGDQDSLFINNKQCSIIGTTEIFQNRVVMLHHTDEDWKGFSTFYVKVNDGYLVEQVITSLKEYNPNFEIESMYRINKEYLDGQRKNYSILLLITLSIFVYSIINISNVIKFMLDERSSRYGIQIALGSTKASIIFEFFMELLLITSTSLIAVLGILYLNQHLIEKYIISIRIDFWVVAASFSTNIMICGLLSILYLSKILSNNVVSLIRGER